MNLIHELKLANSAYASGNPYMTDEGYDRLWRIVYETDPSCPHLYHTANNPNLPGGTAPHAHPIMGTQKAFNLEDLKPFLQRFKDQTLVLEPKYDGCAAVLYKMPEGKFKLLLEGDGQAGRDVTHHLPSLYYAFLPRSINSVEIIIPNASWDKAYGKNQRNTVSGWINRGKFPDNMTAEMVSHTYGNLTHHVTNPSQDDLDELLMTLFEAWSKEYPLDGIMIKVADPMMRLQVGHNGTAYKWSIAWKPPIQTATTTVTAIEWNVSRQGRVIPTVVHNPIDLCSTTNTRVTGNNAKWLRDMGIGVGVKIKVGKAGEIIPKILAVISERANVILPVFCPGCNSTLVTDGVHRMCVNESCIFKQIKSIAYFYSDKGVDLKGIGESFIEELLTNDNIRACFLDRIWCLLDPIQYEILLDIYKVLGSVRADNYIKSLESINNKKSIAHFIAGLGLKNLAYKTVTSILQKLSGSTAHGNVSKERIKEFVSGLVKYRSAEDEMKNFTFVPVEEAPVIRYCITGQLSSGRSEMIDYLTTKRWQFVNQVSKHTDILIVGESPGKTKLTKAKELPNVTIINEDQIALYC